MFSKMIFALLFVASLLSFTSSSQAQTIYRGSWNFEWTVIALGDENRGGTLQLEVTKKRCGGSRTSPEVLQTFFNGIEGKVRWYIDRKCGGNFKVCLLNTINVATCGTFRNLGWT